MRGALRLISPRFRPPLDDGFRPAVLANRAFRQEVQDSGVGVPLVLGLERGDGSISRFETVVFPEGHPRAEANLMYAERLVKFLLWQRGGWKVYVGGPASIGEFIRRTYSLDGERAFDARVMGGHLRSSLHRCLLCPRGSAP